MGIFDIRQKISLFISGVESAPLENKIFNSAAFILSAITIPLAISSLIIQSPWYQTGVLITFTSAFFLFFYYSRFRGRFQSTAKLLIAFSFFFIDFVWFWAAGDTFAVNFLFPLILVPLLTILPVRQHFAFTAISLGNILIVDLMAYNFPVLLDPDVSKERLEQLIESHTYLILIMFLLSLSISFFKRTYDRERAISAKRFTLLENINQGLKNRNQHMQGMAQMVSHNLRSPMAGMKMLLTLYEMQETDDQKEEVFDNLKKGAVQLFGMVEDLSKIMMDYGELVKEKEAIDLEETLEVVKDQLAGQIQQHGVDIQHIFNTLPVVVYSRRYLESIFLNMISNSIKYRDEKRPLKITVRSYLDGNKVMLSFADNGVGIDIEKYEDQLFKMYKTFHGKDEKDSKGVGLFMTKNQVEIMGGKITLTSAVDEGTTFYIELYRS